MRRANIIAAIVLLIGGSFVIWKALQMDYMVEGVPGPGFLPFWCGAVTAFLSAILLVTNIRKEKDGSEEPLFTKKILKNMVMLIGASAIAMFLVKFFGMLICIGVLTGVLSWSFGNKKLKSCVVLTVFTPVGFWLLFVKTLEITLPRGFLGF